MQAKSILITFNMQGKIGDDYVYKNRTERVVAKPDIKRGDPAVFDEKECRLEFEDGIWFTDGCDVFERMVECPHQLTGAMDVKQFIMEAYAALNSVEQIGDSRHIGQCVNGITFDVYINASLDFPDITADSKMEIGEVAYKSWYETWADLLDRPYSFPVAPVRTNAEKFRDAPLKDVIAYAAGAGMTVEEWLAAPSA